MRTASMGWSYSQRTAAEMRAQESSVHVETGGDGLQHTEHRRTRRSRSELT